MMNHWTSVIEGLLFMIGDDGLSIDQLEHVLEINREDIIQCLNEIEMNCRNDARGIELVCYGEQ